MKVVPKNSLHKRDMHKRASVVMARMTLEKLDDADWQMQHLNKNKYCTADHDTIYNAHFRASQMPPGIGRARVVC